MNSPSRSAKIVATLGPSSSSSEAIESLIKAGVNVFRFNFSHGTHEQHLANLERVREAGKKLKTPVAALQDLQGPKLRVGKFPGGSIEIAKDQEVLLCLESTKTPKAAGLTEIPYNYEKLSSEVAVGQRILMDDGNLEVRVTSVESGRIRATVVFGGTLKDHKGMNFPDTKLSVGSFTEKDKKDLEFALKHGFDYIALSFVRTASDIREVKDRIAAAKKTIPVIAKIEKGEAIENLTEILGVTDAVMVARGDLAVEVGTPKVPLLQKKIIRECNQRGIPVITATQMLESMITQPRPSRAEASDVANAVLDGTDALMLSAETASGKHPSLVIEVMDSIIRETEHRARNQMQASRHTLDNKIPDDTRLVEAIEHSASRLASWIGAKAIACTTHTGQAARALAKYRPRVPIFAFSDDQNVRRRLALVWGVQPLAIEPTPDLEKLFVFAKVELAKRGVVSKGDRIVLTAGFPALQHGTTNLLRVATVRSNYNAG